MGARGLPATYRLLTWSCLLGIALAPTAPAQRLGSELLVNSYSTSHQTYPAVAADGAGNFVVVWASDGQDGSRLGVFGQRFDAGGERLGGEFQVNTYTTSEQDQAAVAASDAGEFLVVWRSWDQDGSSAGVFGQIYDAADTPIGGEFQVNGTTSSSQNYPAVAADDQGNFVVVWESSNPAVGVSEARAQRLDATGTFLGSEFVINASTLDHNYPAVAMAGSGDFVVVWLEGDYSGFVHGQRFEADGQPAGDEFQVNTTPGASYFGPAVASDDAGAFVVVWRGWDGDNSGVYGRRYDAMGVPLGAPFRANQMTRDDQRSGTVATDAGGNFAVAWDIGWGEIDGTFVQRFDPAGERVGSDFAIHPVDHDSLRPTLAALGSGQFVAAYSAWDGVTREIFAQRFTMTPPHFRGGFEAGDPCEWSFAVGWGEICSFR